jgi:hypothetical protein
MTAVVEVKTLLRPPMKERLDWECHYIFYQPPEEWHPSWGRPIYWCTLRTTKNGYTKNVKA